MEQRVHFTLFYAQVNQWPMSTRRYLIGYCETVEALSFVEFRLLFAFPYHGRIHIERATDDCREVQLAYCAVGEHRVESIPSH
jgi:hypothetical protein